MLCVMLLKRQECSKFDPAPNLWKPRMQLNVRTGGGRQSWALGFQVWTMHMSEIWRHICHRSVGTHVSVPQPDGDDITSMCFLQIYIYLEQSNCQKMYKPSMVEQTQQPKLKLITICCFLFSALY